MNSHNSINVRNKLVFVCVSKIPTCISQWWYVMTHEHMTCSILLGFKNANQNHTGDTISRSLRWLRSKTIRCKNKQNGETALWALVAVDVIWCSHSEDSLVVFQKSSIELSRSYHDSVIPLRYESNIEKNTSTDIGDSIHSKFSAQTFSPMTYFQCPTWIP